MNRIDNLFKEKKEKILTVYFTAGYPELNDTLPIIKELENNEVDMIEIGIPFSDPLADGPIIQASSQKALENGMSIRLLFQQIRDIRKEVKIPLILFGYLNPVLQYGFEKFCNDASKIGIDGIILPDLPMSEYKKYYETFIKNNSLHFIFLISPETSAKRVKQIDKNSTGFIYVVSSSSTTGTKNEIQKSQIEYFERIKSMQLNHPSLIGFGIYDNKTFETACKYSNGAIIGSAFIKSISQGADLKQNIKEFIIKIKGK
jgi:tryptophan synthase alpha chain